MSARILACSDEDYFKDPCAVPSLSVSTARRLINESPAHGYLYHPRLGGNLTDVTKAMDRGSLVDSLLLGGKGIEVIPGFDDWKKKEAQAKRDEARALGLVPCLEKEWEIAMCAVEHIRQRLVEFGLDLADGSQQLAIEWTEKAGNGAEVLCRGKLDNFSRSRALIWDLKIRDNVAPTKLETHMVDMAYDIQGAAYTSAIEKLYPELLGRVDFMDLFCEPNPPHCMTPMAFAGSMAELGRSKWARAVDIWEHCLRTNKWPGYVTTIYRAEAPVWAINREMEQEQFAS
jgi:hypothetical protein